MDGSPRISKKIKGVDRDQFPKRGNLKKFREFIDEENPQKECFLTGNKISGTPSIDHVIPWSYMYSDDLWNLVYVSPNENSSKRNQIPDKGLIDRLKIRNVKLLERNSYNKFTEELKLSIENDYVEKTIWIGGLVL